MLKYCAALWDGRSSLTYESISFFASDNADAIGRAKRWAASFDPMPEHARLMVSVNGISISGFRPGQF